MKDITSERGKLQLSSLTLIVAIRLRGYRVKFHVDSERCASGSMKESICQLAVTITTKSAPSACYGAHEYKPRISKLVQQQTELLHQVDGSFHSLCAGMLSPYVLFPGTGSIGET